MPFVVTGPDNRWVPMIIYPSLATRIIATPLVVTGQTRYAYSQDFAITNVPCRKAPFIEERPNASERLSGGRISNIEEYVVAFKELFPQFKVMDRLIIDAEEFGISAVETDGSMTYTRLRIVVNSRPA